MDQNLFDFCYNISKKNETVRAFSTFVSNASKPFFFIFYLAGIVYVSVFDIKKITPFTLIPLVCILTSFLLRKLIKKPGPVPEYRNDNSFPSNHAASSGVIAAAFFYVNTPTGILLAVLAVLTGVSRVFSGLHYPYDVLAGWVLALLFGLLFLTGA